MKTLKQIIIATVLIISFQTSFAQNDRLMQAFIRSYDSEGHKDYETAAKQLADVYDKSNYEINLRLGWLYYEQKKYTESKKYYQIAETLMPNALEPMIGYIYPLVPLNEIDGMVDQYNKILKLDPNDINSNYQLGYINYNKKNIDIAKKYFQKIIDLNPSGYEAYLRETWAKINNTKAPAANVLDAFKKSYEAESKKKYQEAIDALMPIYSKDYYDVNLRLGWLHYIALEDAEAIKYYKIAIDLKPNSTEPRFGLVNAAAELGNNNDIETEYKKILEIDPQNTYALYGMGQIFYNRSEYDKALPYFEKVVNLYPFTYKGLLMYAWTNLRLEKNAEAKALFTRVLLLSPKDKSATDGLRMIK
jgi:tetratricopeptide (TPR) repeat protein